jgi:hypothetical protein
MTVQVARLKSGEDVIADVKEIRNKEGNPVAYLFGNPRSLCLTRDSEIQFLTEEAVNAGESDSVRVVFSPFMPLSKDTESLIPFDWVVTIANPLDEVIEMYEENLNGAPSSIAKK